MYHITNTRSKAKPYSVVLVAENGEVLSHHSLKTKQACWKNIQAQLSEINKEQSGPLDFVYAQDDATNRTPLVYKVWKKGHKITDDLPLKPRYIPRKNKSSKKKKPIKGDPSGWGGY